MAERTVNITINYKVNTADVRAAQAASQAAQKATDQLRKSTEDYGKSAAAAHKQAADGAKQAERETSSLSRGFSGLYNNVRLFLTAGLAKELVDISLGMASMAGQMEGVTRAFNRLPNATLLLHSLREATHGTVNDLELMQKALMASNFRIPLEKLGTLLEFAAVKAQQTGQEVNHLVNYIVSGIGYRSIKRLDDLGFTLNRVKEALGGVSLQAASMSEVMDAISKLMQEDLAKTGGFIETAETNVKQLHRAWHELKLEISERGASRGLVQFFTDILTLTRQAIKAQWTWNDAILAVTNPAAFIHRRADLTREVALQELITAEAEKQAAAFERKNSYAKEESRLGNTDAELYNLALTIKANEQEQANGSKRLATLKEELALLKEKNKSTIGLQMNAGPTYRLVQAKEKEIETVEKSNDALKNNHSLLGQVIQILVEYRDSIAIVTEADEEALGIIERKRQEIEALQEQIEKTTRLSDLGPLNARLKKAQSELDDLLGKEKKKKKEELSEITQHLAYLSDLEMHNTKEILKDKVEQRKKAADEEVRIEKEAKEKREKLAEEEKQKREELQHATLSLAEEFLRSSLDYVLESGESETEAVRQRYDEQIELAGDNERAKKELAIKRDRELQAIQEQEKEREKKAATARISIDGLVAIAKIFAQFGWPAGIAPAAIMAAITATNIATVRKFAKGKIGIDGPGNETSDSIPALLSRGESVITAKATRRSMGLLEAIQANKIDDRILQQIDFSGGRTVNASLNDQRIVDKLEAIRKSQGRLEESAGILYRVLEDENGNKQRIRAKSI